MTNKRNNREVDNKVSNPRDNLIRNYELIIAFLLCLILIGTYFALEVEMSEPVKVFLQSLITDTIPIIMAFIISYVFIRRYQQLRREENDNAYLAKTKQYIEEALITEKELLNIREVGIERVYTSIHDAKISEKINSTKNRLYLLTTMMEESYLDVELFRKAHNNGCTDFRVMMLNPKDENNQISAASIERSLELNKRANYLHDMIIERQEDIQHTQLKEPFKINLRHYATRPAMYLIIYDDCAIVGFYWHGKRATDSYMLQVYGVGDPSKENTTTIGRAIWDEFMLHWEADSTKEHVE